MTNIVDLLNTYLEGHDWCGDDDDGAVETEASDEWSLAEGEEVEAREEQLVT